MINETEFHRLANNTLQTLSDALEKADETSLLTLEMENSIITIELQDGRQFIISKHTPSRQLWLSSPVSGGLHFSCNAEGQWILADGRTLGGVLSKELQTIADIQVTF